MSQREIASIAFKVLGKREKIIGIPTFVAKVTKWLLFHFTSQKFYGPIEFFFLTVLTMDMVAPTYGKKTLKDYFESLTA